MKLTPFRSVPFLSALSALSLCTVLCAAPAAAQATSQTVPPTRFERFIGHFDFGISATGEFTSTTSGATQNSTTSTNGTLSQRASSTVGVLATIRAQKSPYVGGEFNFRYARYNQDFTFTGGQVPNFSAQNTANEYTLGYLARPDHLLFGTQPYVGAGAGSVEFKPTRNGGQNLPVQARAAYYYTAGVEAPLIGETLGLRAGFRQVFYLAPDFGQNYLKNKKLTNTAEPTIGLYLHF